MPRTHFGRWRDARNVELEISCSLCGFTETFGSLGRPNELFIIR